jgi:NADH-quinone oxidoreductase subunit C
MSVSYYSPNKDTSILLNNTLSLLTNTFAEEIYSSSIIFDELELYCKKESLIRLISFLKDDKSLLFKQLIDITAIDYPANEERFTVVYNFLSIYYNLRIRIKCSIKEYEFIDSITSIYTNAGWLEREVWDMYGIYFTGHSDLRRLLTDFGFKGHPLRKDFPLSGFVEVFYNKNTQKVEYKTVELEQAYRDFSTENPWSGNLVQEASDVLNQTKQENETEK